MVQIFLDLSPRELGHSRDVENGLPPYLVVCVCLKIKTGPHSTEALMQARPPGGGAYMTIGKRPASGAPLEVVRFMCDRYAERRAVSVGKTWVSVLPSRGALHSPLLYPFCRAWAVGARPGQ